MISNLKNAFSKMSQRALWRGDAGQANMLQNHGMDGLRNNLLRDTPTYKKTGVGLNQNGVNFFSKSKASSGAKNTSASNQNINNSNRNTNVNAKAKNSVASKKSVGASILGSLGL